MPVADLIYRPNRIADIGGVNRTLPVDGWWANLAFSRF